jgi:hypothetical protein
MLHSLNASHIHIAAKAQPRSGKQEQVGILYLNQKTVTITFLIISDWASDIVCIIPRCNHIFDLLSPFLYSLSHSLPCKVANYAGCHRPIATIRNQL